MSSQKIFLFDFDGVIVDGMQEYWHSSLLACERYLNSPNITTIYFWSQNPLISCPNNFTLVFVVTRFCEILLLCINPHIITLVKGQLFAKFGLRSHCSQLEDFRSVDWVWRNRASNTHVGTIWVKLTQYLLDALASKKREGILMVNHH